MELLKLLKVNQKSIPEKYSKGDVIYGGFKPNFENKNEFEEYWKNSSNEVAFTSFTDKKLLVDYIFYQGDGIELIKALDIPNFYEDLSMFHTCPNEVVPSDHLPIVADFFIN